MSSLPLFHSVREMPSIRIAAVKVEMCTLFVLVLQTFFSGRQAEFEALRAVTPESRFCNRRSRAAGTDFQCN
jgi:hypothetical protein